MHADAVSPARAGKLESENGEAEQQSVLELPSNRSHLTSSDLLGGHRVHALKTNMGPCAGRPTRPI